MTVTIEHPALPDVRSWDGFTYCEDFLRTVSEFSDRMIVLNPGFPPPGWSSHATTRIRAGEVGRLFAWVPSDGGDRRNVQVLLDSHDPLAYGMPNWQGSATRAMRVPVDALLKASVTSAVMLQPDEVVSFSGDHTGFPGAFDLAVTLDTSSGQALYDLLPPEFVERHDPSRSEPFLTFKAASTPLGGGVYELWLLMGGRGGSAPVELPRQFWLGGTGDERAYAWPIYATYGGPRRDGGPVALDGASIELGKIYVYGAGRPCVPVSEEEDGRHTVLLLDGDGVPEYREAQRTDLIAITEAQRESFSRGYAETLITALLQTRRERRSHAERADRLRAERDTAWRNHEADIEAISARFIQEAEDRSWCGEYDRVIDDLNEELHKPMRERQREYEVRVRVTYYTTVTVTARDAEAAENEIDDDRSQVLDDLDTDDYDEFTITSVDES